MKISRLSHRYADELLELAEEALDTAKSDNVESLRTGLKWLAKEMRFMVEDNERFLND